MSAQLHFNICKELEVKSDSKHLYEQVTKLVETRNEGKVTLLCYQKCKTTEPSLTINRTLQSVRQKYYKERSRESSKIQKPCNINLGYV